MLHPLKIIWTLVSLNILLNSSLGPWMYRTETKASLVVSWVEALSICGKQTQMPHKILLLFPAIGPLEQ